MKILKEGDPREAGMLLLQLDHSVKLVVIVDEDIDVHQEDRVLWALATRMQPDQDVEIISGMKCNVLDPSSQNGISSKMIIDATKGLDWELVPCSFPEDVIQDVKKLLSDL